MEWFKQKNDDTSQNFNNCSCKEGGVFLDKRHLSRLTALFLLIVCFVFVGGYFWGQKVATEQLLNAVERDSFADQVYYSMCSVYDLKDDEESNEPDDVSGVGNEQAKMSSPSAKVESAQPTYAPVKVDKKYVAQLAGFGSLNMAQQLVNRLNKKNIKVVVSKRQSKTVKGNVVNWYQVVTPAFENRDALNELVATIRKNEKLHDVRIVEVGVS